MRVVVVGGGFAGVRTAAKLAARAGIEVKLISEEPIFQYHAALYRSATGRSPLEVAIPLRDFFKRAANVEVIKDQAVTINPAHQEVVGKSGSRYHYDALVLALGNVTEYFGIRGLEQFSYGIKTINEALKLKRHLHEELAEKSNGRTNYVVVGGGATGVELAAELVSYTRHIRRRHKRASEPFKVILVEASERLMPALPPRFSAAIAQRLRALGVELHLKTVVRGEGKNMLDLPGAADIRTHSVVWTAGVVNNPLFARHPHLFKLDKAQRVVVDKQLRAAPNIYVIGDSAQTRFTGMAQTALRQGEFVAANLLRKHNERPLLDYKDKQPIYAIPVGPRWSAVLWGRLPFYGYIGWLIRRWADLRLYLKFMPTLKAFRVWRYGYQLDEACPECR